MPTRTDRMRSPIDYPAGPVMMPVDRLVRDLFESAPSPIASEGPNQADGGLSKVSGMDPLKGCIIGCTVETLGGIGRRDFELGGDQDESG
jgi:hypothetical protein